ncbi:MAG: tetratricopeptide repeat protein [Alphaproteobacteria bacterium]|nr:tetratricopeptide repeat protein [Alphaproteobacteria bacterium]
MRVLAAILSLFLLVACSGAANAPRDPQLDRLFAELAAAPDADEARAVEERIWARWRDSGSATVDVLLERAAQAESAGEAGLAVEFLSEASDLAPHFAEPWNRRAVLAYDQQDFAGAISAINETLKREPRHFGALTGLGLIYEDLGRTRSALRAYRAALEVHPYFEEARRGVRRLEPLIDGAEA